MKIGVDYYPEQWDSTFWEKDAEMMAKTGIKIVRIGELAWSRFEPREGEFDFQWFDDIMRTFKRYGIEVVMGVPAGKPPMWLYKAHPEIMGTVSGENSEKSVGRGSRCMNSPVYINYVRKITERMVRRYGSDPNVAAWQADNEPDASPCTCEVCSEQFRTWLIDKYDSIENINFALGSEYSDVSQIEPPVYYSGAVHDPTLCLEYSRFCSDSTAKFVKEIVLTIKRECPKAKVTVNARFSKYNPDFYRLFGELDLVSCNNCVSLDIPDDPDVNYSNAFFLDFMRGIKGRNFWIMEQSCGLAEHPLFVPRTTKPGQLSGYAFQALAHGADNILFYRWRSAVSGSDMFAHGLIDHSNIPGRRFYEFSEFCKTIMKLGVLDTTELVSDIAILYLPDNEWALEIQPQSEGFDYIGQLKNFHSAFSKYGANIDVVSPDADLSGYKAVIAPAMYVYKKSAAENIYRYVINGGTLVMTCRSGVKDSNNNCVMDTLPSVYKELIGAEVTEYDPIGNHEQTIVDFAGNKFACRQWCDVLRLTTARAYAEYDDSFYKCCPAVTMNRYCSGVAYYVGTICHADFYESLAGNIMRQTGVPRLMGLPRGVEVTTRTNGLNDFICFFNNSGQEAVINLPKSMYSIIESIGKEKINLKPFGFDIVRK